MNTLVILLAIQTLVSILIILWVRLKVLRSLDDGDSIARVRREIGALIVELDGSADRNITVIEDRLRELKDCITEADKRIVMLSNERARAWVASPVPVQQDQKPIVQALQLKEQIPSPQVAAVQAPSQPTEQRIVQTPAPEKETNSVAASGTNGNAQTAPIPFIRFSEKPVVFEEPFADRVSRLYKRGFSSDIIAAKLKATISEVDLVIATGGNPPEGRGEG